MPGCDLTWVCEMFVVVRLVDLVVEISWPDAGISSGVPRAGVGQVVVYVDT